MNTNILNATKKPIAMTGFDVPIESVLKAEVSDKHILTRLILPLSTISKTLSIAARYAVEYVRFISPAYQKAISNQRLPLLTNYAEFAAHDKGNGWKPVNESMSCQRIGKKAICVTCIDSNPYRMIRRIACWVSLVFLGLGMNDALLNPR